MTTYCKCSSVLQLRDTSVIHRHIPVKGKPSGIRKKSMQIILPFIDLINIYFQIKLQEEKVIVMVPQH